MGVLTDVGLETRPFDGLRAVIDDDTFDEFRTTICDAARVLDGRTLWNINSTAEGGGVAEMLSTLLPYCVDAGWNVRWEVMSGSDEFFDVTKDLHNALHGSPPAGGDLDANRMSIYADTTRMNADDLTRDVQPGDVVLVHDPQAAGLIGPLSDVGAHVSWQCHIGTDTPNDHTRGAWDVLRDYVQPAERYVFTRAGYLWDGLDDARLRVIPPAIDPLSPKNAPLSDDEARSTLRDAEILDGLPDGARIVLQVSRWDRLKDPMGFVRMFDEHLTDLDGVHLVFAGPAVADVDDDPEGAEIFAACEELWRSLAPSVRERVHLLTIPMDDVDRNARIVNALQRRAGVVVQKSIQEGFGLTVSEAMWKSKPVVATRVGGIQDQIEHDTSGLLVDDPYDLDAFADGVRTLLTDDACAQRLGVAARARVQERFLGPRILTQYAELISELV